MSAFDLEGVEDAVFTGSPHLTEEGVGVLWLEEPQRDLRVGGDGEDVLEIGVASRKIDPVEDDESRWGSSPLSMSASRLAAIRRSTRSLSRGHCGTFRAPQPRPQSRLRAGAQRASARLRPPYSRFRVDANVDLCGPTAPGPLGGTFTTRDDQHCSEPSSRFRDSTVRHRNTSRVALMSFATRPTHRDMKVGANAAQTNPEFRQFGAGIATAAPLDVSVYRAATCTSMATAKTSSRSASPVA